MEYKKLSSSPVTNVKLYLPSGEDLYSWEGLITGPKDSLYDGKFMSLFSFIGSYGNSVQLDST